MGRVLLLLAAWALLLPLARLEAQQVSDDDDSAVEEVELELEAAEAGVTPGGAFLRSLLVPGWGHAATETYARAGFYVTAQTGSLWMLWQTIARRAEAATFERRERRLVEQRHQGPDISPDSLRMLVDEDPDVARWTALVEARDQQVEDWAALSLFIVLLGATDAFVAAHLADYPEPLSLDLVPRPTGGIELSFSLPMGPPPGFR